MFWTLTSYFNPCGYNSRLANYREFRRRLTVPRLWSNWPTAANLSCNQVKRFGFDPFTDVAIADNGCWRWSSGKVEMHD